MMKIVKGLPDDVLGIEAEGKLSVEDYENTLIPAMNEKLEKYEQVKMLFNLSNYKGFEITALWEDLRFGIEHWGHFSHIALVCDDLWIKQMTAAFVPLFPGEVMMFGSDQRGEAYDWIVQKSEVRKKRAA